MPAAASPYFGFQFISTRGGDQVFISMTGSDTVGCASPCDVKVLLDGIESPSVTVVNAQNIRVVAPPHSQEGIAPVVVVTPSQRIEVAPVAYVVERVSVLVPLFGPPSPGAEGALWNMELWVHNSANVEITSLRPTDKIWAMLSVTDNATGHVTMITSQP